MKKKICVVTGTRAEYGLFYPLLKKIAAESGFKLQIIATGMHLSDKFGLTYREIEKDGFKIDKRIKILLYGDTDAGVTKAIGLGIMKFSDAFSGLRPDMVILLGDRFEAFAAAVAAFLAKIPIAHIHGGELTRGLIDDAFRHSMTKMSLLHFASAEDYKKRIIQLGELPNKVFNVGALGVDNIKNQKLLDKKRLERELNFDFGKKNVLVTFHSVTLEDNTSGAQFRELLGALDRFRDLKIIFTKTNADPGGAVINRMIDNYVKKNPQRAISFFSMGRLRYLSTIQFVDAVVGNSSSGIIEAPSLGKPTVNIGDRQAGRVMGDSVINSAAKKAAIVSALKKALSGPFSRRCKKTRNPYGRADAAENIIRILKREIPKIKSTKKTFYDLKVNT